MLESSRSPIVKCNCITLIHEQGTRICRYERPINAKVQVLLEEILKGETRANIAHKLNTNKLWVAWGLSKAREATGASSSLDSARLALQWGWIQK